MYCAVEPQHFMRPSSRQKKDAAPIASTSVLALKGIVSPDWAGLQMGSLDRSKFRTIPLEVYF
jgi:hypothetical protein